MVQVDAFTDRPFTGNPAAVCVLDAPLSDARMQAVAAEMNASETAFLRRRDDAEWDLRWFTPTLEVDLCGHATLASAHVLWAEGHTAAPSLRFHTLGGRLGAEREDGWIRLDFPAEPAEPAEAPDGLIEALGIAPRFVGRNRMDYLVEAGSEAEIRALAPGYDRLRRVPARGVMVTAPATGTGADFVSRWFGPQSGVDEDPVTGSAHCALAPYWAARLGRDSLVGFQVSPRGGTVRVRLRGNRVELAGQAVTVLRGTLEWP